MNLSSSLPRFVIESLKILCGNLTSGIGVVIWRLILEPPSEGNSQFGFGPRYCLKESVQSPESLNDLVAPGF